MCGGKTVAAQMSSCIAWTQNTLQKYSFRLPPKLYFLKCILLHRYADADDDCDADADDVTPSSNNRSYTRRSVPSPLRRSFLASQSDAHRIAPHRDFHPTQSIHPSTYSSKGSTTKKNLCSFGHCPNSH